MKIENRENIKGNIKTIVVVDNVKYQRVQKTIFIDESPVIEWKKIKTGHLLNADKSKLFEEKFKVIDNTTKPVKLYNETPRGPAQISSSGGTMFFEYSSAPTKIFDEGIMNHLRLGNLISAVKYYKEVSGLGLKEAKDYVDSLNINHLANNKWENGMALTRESEERQRQVLIETGKFFKNNASRKQFIDEMKKTLKNTAPLSTVKLIMDKTGWGLYNSKVFFDLNIKEATNNYFNISK